VLHFIIPVQQRMAVDQVATRQRRKRALLETQEVHGTGIDREVGVRNPAFDGLKESKRP